MVFIFPSKIITIQKTFLLAVSFLIDFTFSTCVLCKIFISLLHHLLIIKNWQVTSFLCKHSELSLIPWFHCRRKSPENRSLKISHWSPHVCTVCVYMYTHTYHASSLSNKSNNNGNRWNNIVLKLVCIVVGAQLLLQGKWIDIFSW